MYGGLSLRDKVEILTGVNVVGFILVMMAGWVDTAGVKVFLNERVSFMTGRAAQLGEWLAEGELEKFSYIVLIVLMFILGSAVSTKITRRWGLVGGLTFTAGLLFFAALPVYIGQVRFVAIAIPLAMGAQNAATSLTEINRTTHLTGPATDIGIRLSDGDINGAIFWILRWIAFPLGAFMSYEFVEVTINNDNINTSLSLIIPAVIIILTALIQKRFVDIKLLKKKI